MAASWLLELKCRFAVGIPIVLPNYFPRMMSPLSYTGFSISRQLSQSSSSGVSKGSSRFSTLNLSGKLNGDLVVSKSKILAKVWSLKVSTEKYSISLVFSSDKMFFYRLESPGIGLLLFSIPIAITFVALFQLGFFPSAEMNSSVSSKDSLLTIRTSCATCDRSK